MSWNDFNSAKDQTAEPIPVGTLVKVRITIKPGGHDDAAQGWTGGYATRNNDSGAVYLNAEFVVLEGQYAKRKVWNNIGLHSNNSPVYAEMGRSFIKAILNSARNINPKDNSPQAQAARRINGLADLDGLTFIGRISMGTDKSGNPKNEITVAITPDHKEYAALMGTVAVHAPAAAPATAPHSSGRPNWAQ